MTSVVRKDSIRSGYSVAVPVVSAADSLSVSPADLAIADDAEVLADIYTDAVAIAVWQRSLTPSLDAAVASLLALPYKTTLKLVLAAATANETLRRELPAFHLRDVLIDDLSLLVDMFCCLFGLQQVGLRLSVLDNAMCPRFHVDRIPCRLVTSYGNPATEWLPNFTLDRRKLGAGSGGLSDAESGLYKQPQDIQRLAAGDVALLKGELWNETIGRGVVHRSPALSAGVKRLLMTLDFA